MNKTLLIVLFSLLVIGLSAQMGLFEISYGTSKDEAIGNLIDKGFEIYDSTDSYVSLVPTNNDLVDSIELEFENADETLSSWTIYYLFIEDGDIEEIVMDALISWHGEDYYYLDEYETYTWYLDEEHSVSAGYDSYYNDIFWVSYLTENQDQ